MKESTKKPWSFDLKTWRITGSDGSVVANIVPWNVTGSRNEDVDNGNLIAAAPDLYEALESIVYAETQDELYALLKNGRKALAKARGEL